MVMEFRFVVGGGWSACLRIFSKDHFPTYIGCNRWQPGKTGTMV